MKNKARYRNLQPNYIYRQGKLLHGIIQGRIKDFKLGGGAHLKKLHRAEGGAENFGVFRVKNHDFTPKKSYFFQF
jgi:hypothetical protein